MVQAKISAFFKSPTVSAETSVYSHNQTEGNEDPEENDEDVLITYKRRGSETRSDCDKPCEKDNADMENPSVDSAASPKSTRLYLMPEVLNKKRKYIQSHLDLGQSDFILHTCSSCGLRYTCGREEDEKVHKAYHKNYLEGVQYKGWCNERIISVETNAERIVLVLATDPPSQRRKIQEVAKSMEKDLYCGVDWLLNQSYQAYLFISKKRVAGCLIIEPIQRAYKLVSNSLPTRTSSDGLENEAVKSNLSVSGTHNTNSAEHASSILRFGNVNFQRECVKRKHAASTDSQPGQAWYIGAILSEEVSVPAICGIRAIWVSPAHRRRHIATKLLDAARKRFGIDREVEPSECAFCHPTSLGCAFAASYCGALPFLVYKDSC